jgi:hypothetical protein
MLQSLSSWPHETSPGRLTDRPQAVVSESALRAGCSAGACRGGRTGESEIFEFCIGARARRTEEMPCNAARMSSSRLARTGTAALLLGIRELQVVGHGLGQWCRLASRNDQSSAGCNFSLQFSPNKALFSSKKFTKFFRFPFTSNL